MTEAIVSTARPAITVRGLVLFVALVTVAIATVLPVLLRARISSNETGAIGTLRTLSTAEASFQAAAVVDWDADGTGEFGWLQELTGVTGYRVPAGLLPGPGFPPARADGRAGLSDLPTSPAFITSVLGTTARSNGGVASKSGYSFLIFLPRATGAAIREASPPFAGFSAADANGQEVRFACYAWPAELGQTGRRAFVVSQGGEVFATANLRAQNYGGTTLPPNLTPAAAFAALTPPGTYRDPANLEGEFVRGALAVDGYRWAPAGN